MNYKNPPVPAVLILLAGLFISGCAPAGPVPEEMMAAAAALDARFLEAYNRGDVDSVMATFWNNPEVVIFPAGGLESRTWQKHKEDLALTFETAPTARLEFAESNYRAAGDVVYGWGRWKWTLAIPERDPILLYGYYTNVMSVRDGRWVYLVDHSSTSLPPIGN